jgi:tetratricopeptide (TPR) repeat protein
MGRCGGKGEQIRRIRTNDRRPRTNGRRARRGPRPIQLRISYDSDLDFLWALRPGEAVDGQLEDETTEVYPGVYVYRRGPEGPVKGFGIEGLYNEDWVPEELAEVPLLRFHAPTLGLRSAGLIEVTLAARAALKGASTPDVVFFDSAVAASQEGDLEEAEMWWRGCLECGKVEAHFGLGYTLFDLELHQEAYAHLRAYTGIVPRNSWAWCWRGKAAEAIGEHSEAARCYRRAVQLEQIGAYETDAERRLVRLRRKQKQRGGRERARRD